MRIPSGSHVQLRRYITLFCSFALGLAILLVIAGCKQQPGDSPLATDRIQATNPAGSTIATQFGTQAQAQISSTPLPAIPPTPNERTPSPLGVTAAQLNGLQLRLWYPWTGGTGAAFQAVLDEFNRINKYGIAVTANAYESFGSLDDAVETAIESNTLPDVLVDYSYQARRWDSRGVLVDLAPYVNDSVWGFTADEQADFISTFWTEDLVEAGITPSSRRLGIPYYRSAYVMFYNQTWAEQLGYPEPPTTPEDFRMQACAAADDLASKGDKTSLGQGGWLITPEPGVLTSWIYAFGGGITNPGTSGYLFNTPKTGQGLAFLKGLQESGCAWMDSSVDANAVFARRQALFLVGTLNDIAMEKEAFLQVHSTDEWIVLPFPSSAQPVVTTYGPSLLVSKSTPEKQLAAWLVIEWLAYPPNQAEFAQQLGAYPTRRSTSGYLTAASGANPQWSQALALLPDAQGEPTFSSWNTVRWMLSDASIELFSPQFGSDEVPSLLVELDSLAEEILNQVH